MNSNIELKSKDGMTNFMLETSGNQWVYSHMESTEAKKLVEGGKVSESDNPEYPICVETEKGEKFLFAGKFVIEEKKKPEKKKR